MDNLNRKQKTKNMKYKTKQKAKKEKDLSTAHTHKLIFWDQKKKSLMGKFQGMSWRRKWSPLICESVSQKTREWYTSKHMAKIERDINQKMDRNGEGGGRCDRRSNW